jgi:hypothetical protein
MKTRWKRYLEKRDKISRNSIVKRKSKKNMIKMMTMIIMKLRSPKTKVMMKKSQGYREIY